MLKPWVGRFAGILLALAVTRVAHAETILVPCDASTLGPAVTAANTSGGATTIFLAAGCTYNLVAALPDVTSDITVEGQGATVTRSTSGGTPTFRIFTVASGALALRNLTVSNGFVQSSDVTPSDHALGGCISTVATLSLSGVTVSDCTVMGSNTVSPPGNGLGGGIYVNGGTASLVNSTISGSSALGGGNGTGRGGDIYVEQGAVTLTSVTVSSGTAVQGGGIFAASGMFTVANSILADSAPTDCDQATGIVVSSGWNVVEAPGGCANFTAATHDLLNVDPKLGPLKSNGGPTFTQAIPTTSIAFERGHCSQTTDQRGVRRLNLPICEIGAYEVTRFLLHVVFQGAGHGTVTSGSGRVLCDVDCDVIELQGAGEDLTASPDPGSTFVGWGDACTGTGLCSVLLTMSDQTVLVNFGVVVPTPDAPPPGADAPAGQPDAPASGQPDAGIGGAIDAPIGGAPDAAGGSTIDAPAGGGDAGAAADAPLPSDGGPGGDAGARDAAVADAQLADAQPSDGGASGNADGPGILPLDRGCGCGVGADPAQAPSLLLLVGVTALLARRRKRS
jgi:MYXO-CTERM domain-containing protein